MPPDLTISRMLKKLTMPFKGLFDEERGILFEGCLISEIGESEAFQDRYPLKYHVCQLDQNRWRLAVHHPARFPTFGSMYSES